MLKVSFKRSEFYKVLFDQIDFFNSLMEFEYDGDFKLILNGEDISNKLDFKILFSEGRTRFCLDTNECVEFLEFLEDIPDEDFIVNIFKHRLIVSYPASDDFVKQLEFKH